MNLCTFENVNYFGPKLMMPYTTIKNYVNLSFSCTQVK